MIRVTNEYEIVNKSYKVNSHNIELNSNFNESNFASYLAEKEELRMKQIQHQKELLIKERELKTKDYIKDYKLKNNIKEKEAKEKDNQKQILKINQKEYNKNLQKQVITKSKKTDCSTSISINYSKDIFPINHSIINRNESNFYQIDEEDEPYPNNIKEIGLNTSNEAKEESDDKVIDLLDNLNKKIIDKITPLKTDVIENVFKQNLSYTSTVKSKEIAFGIESIKDFRKRGVINMIEDNKSTMNIEKVDDDEEKPRDLSQQRAKGFKTILHKQRYIRALKNLMIDKFSEKNIIIPSICSCGQLQKKLDTILEKGNISVQSIINVECANNCIYYKNSKDYQKALSDIISSIKNIKLESFVK